MEYDTYDTPATTYLAWRDQDNIVRGCARLFPTTRPYMIEELWPDSVQSQKLPKSPNVWEASRFCIDKKFACLLQKGNTRRAFYALFKSSGSNTVWDWMIGVMTPPIWRAVFIKAGWPIEYLGNPLALTQKEKIIAGKMKISKKILNTLQHKFEIFPTSLGNKAIHITEKESLMHLKLKEQNWDYNSEELEKHDAVCKVVGAAI